MIRPCPDCFTDLVELTPEAEMGIAPARYWCPHCEVTFERDAGELLVEVED